MARYQVLGIDAAAERVEHVRGGEVLAALRAADERDRGRDGVHADAGSERAGGEFGEAGERLLGDGVGEKIGVEAGKLGVEEVDDGARGRCAGARTTGTAARGPGRLRPCAGRRRRR
jgi:hypothetical protein